MDVYEYFRSRERECNEMSLAPDTCFDDMFGEEAGTDGRRGTVYGRVVLADNAFLSMYEEVVVQGSGVHREAYSYYLIVDGFEAWGYDRDPSHDPVEHMHVGADHKRQPCGPVTFKEVARTAWETVSREEDLTATTVNPDTL